MVFRNCAGGVVFFKDKVYLLKNEKQEWVLPKGVIRDRQTPKEVALERVNSETGIDAEILSQAGETSYEFYSITRRKPVCNRVTWFIMRAPNERYRIAFEQGFLDGDFFEIPEALNHITYSQDVSLVKAAYDRFIELTKC